MQDSTIVIKAKDKTKRAFSSVNKGLGKMRGGLNSTFLKVGLLAGVAGFGALIRSSSKTADALAKTADKIGVSTEALAGLQNAAEITGVSQETLNKALVKQQVAIADYSKGIGLAKTEFEKLGFAQDELGKLDATEQFIKISEALKQVKNSTDRVNIAYKIYGGRATDLLNTLDLGEEGLRAFREESELLGTSLSRIDAAKIEASNDAFTRIGQVAKGFGLQLTAKIAPLMEALASSFVNVAKESGGMGNVVTNIFDNLITGVGYVANAFRGMEIIWQGLRVAFAGMVDFVIGGLNDLQNNIVGFINVIPGIDITPFEGLANAAQAIGTVSVDAQAKLMDLMMQPLPSENFKQWSTEVQEQATLAAEKIAATKLVAGGGALEGGNDALGEADQQKLNAKLARLELSLLTEKERLVLADEEKRLIAEESFQNKLITGTERDLLLETLALAHEKKLTDITNKGLTARQKFDKLSTSQKVKTQLSLLTQMTQGVASGSKKMFKINKALALANAAVSLPDAVIQSFRNAGGYPWGIIPAALMAASGLAQIKAIKSASFGGGGSGAPVSGGGGGLAPSLAGTGVNSVVGTVPVGSTNSAAQQQTLSVSFGDNPDDLLQVSGMRTFIERMLETAEDMGPNTKIVLT